MTGAEQARALGVACDHAGGFEYWCAECRPTDRQIQERVAAAEAALHDTREALTRQHSTLWLLGLDNHEDEEPQTREDCHRNLDALLDAVLARAGEPT